MYTSQHSIKIVIFNKILDLFLLLLKNNYKIIGAIKRCLANA